MKTRIALATIAITIGTIFYIYGRGIWYPAFVQLAGKRVVADVISEIGPEARSRLLPYFRTAQVSYPPDQITLLAVKSTGLLELWAQNGGSSKHIRTYIIHAQSGDLGPKLREGDKQVPEGIYRIEGLNPNSSYHLSMKLNYPNEFDLKHAQIEGRQEPGSNIFIHGKAVSIGCLAMGDVAIEELFALVHDVGKEKVKVVIAPQDPRKLPLDPSGKPLWVTELYNNITQEFKSHDQIET